MSRHQDVYGNLDVDAGDERAGRGTRFLKRASALDARVSGAVEEKVLHWVDPAECRMWAGHNRAYDLLTEERCRDLIDGIRAQGRQEFPAIVRPAGEGTQRYEVICGARRHFAVSWLRANGYTQFRYLIEVRDLSDEEAFRLADIENREREDLSDYERARDYARALDSYYGGEQKRMAERLEVSPAWLSRYLALARLPEEIVAAYADLTHVRERHARALTAAMRDTEGRKSVLREAASLASKQAGRRDAGQPPLDGAQVIARLTAASKQADLSVKRRARGGVAVRKRRDGVSIDIPSTMSLSQARKAVLAALEDAYSGKLPMGNSGSSS